MTGDSYERIKTHMVEGVVGTCLLLVREGNILALRVLLIEKSSIKMRKILVIFEFGAVFSVSSSLFLRTRARWRPLLCLYLGQMAI